jgi:hypothetical protein
MLLGRTAQPARKADNLTAICEPTVWIMRDPQHFTKVSKASFEDSFMQYGYIYHLLAV